MTKWVVPEIDERVAARIEAEAGLSSVMARVMVARGIETAEDARAFLDPVKSDLHDPFLLKDMDRAVTRIHTAVYTGDKILVFGDYDVDGISSAALVVETLRSMGADVYYEVPDRLTEGYGLNTDRVRAAADAGVKLIITVDNGVSCHEEVALAAELGVDLIVTDHHEPEDSELPAACAVLDPKRPDATYPHTDLAGVGVAAKLCEAMTGRKPSLDLVALGTVADVVPLRGENRTLVSLGLDELRKARRVGLRCLADVAGIKVADLKAYHIAFQLGPRLNAAGRIGRAADGIDLLLEPDEKSARGIAQRLDNNNRERKETGERIREEAADMLDCSFSEEQRTIVLAGEEWHPGIVGIVASRIVEKYHRPAVLLAIDGEFARGSARSVRTFDLFDALSECSDIIEKFGGHKYAAGLTIRTDRIDELRRRLEQVGRKRLTDSDLVPETRLDTWIEPDEVSDELVTELARVEPCGFGNPRPLLGLRSAVPAGHVRLMRNDSARFALRCGDKTFSAIAFRMPELKEMLNAQLTLDIAFQPEINVWRGKREFRLLVKKVRARGQ